MTGAGGSPAGPAAAAELEFLDPAVTEAALSVLSRKLRAELMLALLEDFVAGRRSARSVLADFAIAADKLGPSRGSGGIGGASTPEWERLRQVGRDKGEPVVEWEILHALHTIAAAPSPGPRARTPAMTVDSLEQSMELGGPGGLDPRFSLHAYLSDARSKLGPQLQPRDTEVLAGTLRRIDHVRQMLKPGGLSFDLGISEPVPSAVHAADVDSARQVLGGFVRTAGPQMAAAVGIQMLRQGVPDRTGTIHSDPAIDQAVAAGQKIVTAQAARAAAQRAREQAEQVRGRRVAAGGVAVYLGGTAGTIGATAVSLAAGVRAELAPLIGIGAGAATLLGRALQDWEASRLPLVAPFRAWWSARRAARAERLADRAVDDVFTTHHTPRAGRSRGTTLR
jgi:hypothetical protein